MKEISIVGILYDEKSTHMRGPALAPPLIRECYHSGSANDFAENGKNVNQPSVHDEGDFEINEYFDIEKIIDEQLSNNRRTLTLGGDHSITYPIIKAYKKHYPNFTILHIDAHGDLYHEFNGDPYSHACPFARIMENNLCDRLVQVGIRTLTDHQKEQADKFGVEIMEMKNHDLNNLPTIKGPLYISLDLDAFDPAFAPGVSHHEPGGMTTRQVLDLFASLDQEIIGADIVEYNPKRDPSEITVALAAKMKRELLSKML